MNGSLVTELFSLVPSFLLLIEDTVTVILESLLWMKMIFGKLQFAERGKVWYYFYIAEDLSTIFSTL